MTEPFYFGEADDLFGVYNQPLGGNDREHGVVLCYPYGQEYVRVHRSFQQLALRLAHSGFHVLRFDFFGAGDSMGGSAEGGLDRWMQDVATAVEELEDYSELNGLSLVGLRLGASVAALAGAMGGRFENLVLWEPVVTGAAYLEESGKLQQKWLRDQLDKPGRDKWAVEGMEVIGFPFSEALQQDLKFLNLLELPQPPAKNNLILVRENTGGLPALLAAYLQKQDCNCDYLQQPGSAVWSREERLENTLVPNESLDAIVSWLNKVTA